MAKLTLTSLHEIILEQDKRIASLEAKVLELKPRDRGPASTRAMSEEDARRIMLGDLKDTPHKKAAEELGLSYGQVYSARGGYTFKHIMGESLKANKK